MEHTDIEILVSTEVRNLIDHHIEFRADQLALKLRAPLVTQQIKLLQKCRQKLPTYYQARCLLSQVTYEQSSSEVTALSRLQAMSQESKLAVDLTCGLGVDSWAFSRKFERVVSVETDPLRVEIARLNFERLGISNVEVVQGVAEQFMADYIGEKIDLAYVDPSRKRGDGKRVYSLEDSSPNILELLPVLREKADRIIVKLSPLFDVEEVYRVFGEDIAVEVISVGGECKEVLAKIGFTDEPDLRVTVIGEKVHRYDFSKNELQNKRKEDRVGDEIRFLLLPDVAFYKARTVAAYAARCVPGVLLSEYLYANELPDEFEGKTYRITFRAPYRPKEIGRMLKTRGIRRVSIHRRNFPYSSDQIVKALHVDMGGVTEIFCTMVAGEPTVFFVARLS